MSERPSQHPVPGQIFAGRYRIERFLAQGGYGAVYVAEQLSTEAPVALKVLSPHVLASPDAVSRFELEAKVAGRVRSDFIVRILDAGVDEATRLPYLAMELLEGESLLDHVKRIGPLSAADAVTFLLQVAQGLDKAHGYVTKEGKTAPIVHRDLKPENLFLTVREDGLPVVKILDFGIAKVVSDDVAMSRGIKGTPLYMAHEQLHGELVSPQTDIWALGLVAFFLLTARSYWATASSEESNLSAVIAEVLTSTIVTPRERAQKLGFEPWWNAAFDDWFLRCVNRKPEARFPSAGEAASALASALLGDGWSATLPPNLFASLPSAEGAVVRKPLPLRASESVPASVVSAAHPRQSFVSRRVAAVGVAALFIAAFSYAVLRRESPGISTPETPVRANTASTGLETATATPPGAQVGPLASPPLVASAPAPSASADLSGNDRSAGQNTKRVGPHGKVDKPTQSNAPSATASSDRIYNER